MSDDLMTKSDGFRLGTCPTDDDVYEANFIIDRQAARISELEKEVGRVTDAAFDRVWELVKDWDISTEKVKHRLYEGINGDHVRSIIAAAYGASPAPVTVRKAARVLLNVFEDPDNYAPDDFDWQFLYGEMTADHKESLTVCGVPDWPATLVVALRILAEENDDE